MKHVLLGRNRSKYRFIVFQKRPVELETIVYCLGNYYVIKVLQKIRLH